MKKIKCKVTAIVKGKKENISESLTKQKAETSAKNLRKDMKIAIPKFKWAKNIRVECN